MPGVAIVTDCTSTLTKEIAEQHNIKVVPYHIYLDEKHYLDMVELAPEEFYKWQREKKGLLRHLLLYRKTTWRRSEWQRKQSLIPLAKMGRVGRAAVWGSSLLNIKPILEVPTSTGITTPIERVRGNPKALHRLLEIIRERVGTKPVHIIVHHTERLEQAEWLKAQVSSQFNCAELYLSEYIPGAALQVGPGLVGLSFYSD